MSKELQQGQKGYYFLRSTHSSFPSETWEKEHLDILCYQPQCKCEWAGINAKQKGKENLLIICNAFEMHCLLFDGI